MMRAAVRQRMLKLLGESGFWRVTGRLHAKLYRLTGGRIGGPGGGLDHLLLTTVGRHSGRLRTAPLTYLRDGTGFVLVASNGGSDRPPAWYYNLRDQPDVVLEVSGKRFEARARVVDDGERARLWPRLTAYNPFYADYALIADREIPVVICEPSLEDRRG